MEEYLSFLAGNFIISIPNLFTALLIVIISYYVGLWLSRLLSRVLRRQNAEPGVSQLLTQIVKWTIISLGTIAALQRFFDVTAFLTGLGIIGFTIGFALQNILQNFVSGIILLVQHPFKIGDVAELAGFDGTVLNIGLRTTEMKTLDGRIVFLPNGDVLAKPIINYTRANLRRVDLSISVDKNSDPETVRAVILRVLKNVKGYMDTPEPLALFHAFGNSSVDLIVQFWVNTAISSTPVSKNEALTLIKKEFEQMDIETPYLFSLQAIQAQRKKPLKRPVKNGAAR